MTQLQFIAKCGQYLIDPALALENENIASALRDRNYELIETILREEF